MPPASDMDVHVSTTSDDLKEILKDLNDPIIPIRAAGLVALRKLVLIHSPG